jgi:epoxyqueuosine reductase
MKRIEANSAREIRKIAAKHGADLVGFADSRKLRGVFTHPADLLEEFPYAISLCVGLDKWDRYDTSTEDEFSFPRLEAAAAEVAKAIEKMGHKAKVIPPDRRVAHNSPLYWNGEISHKAVAKTAGLGWIGRSTLFVSSKFGPRICLATIMTDMPLPVGTPLKNRCGKCSKCIKSCPRGALRGACFEDHPKRIDLAIDVKDCGSLVNRTWKDGSICYECMLACPVGRRGRR